MPASWVAKARGRILLLWKYFWRVGFKFELNITQYMHLVTNHMSQNTCESVQIASDNVGTVSKQKHGPRIKDSYAEASRSLRESQDENHKSLILKQKQLLQSIIHIFNCGKGILFYFTTCYVSLKTYKGLFQRSPQSSNSNTEPLSIHCRLGGHWE